MGQKGEMEELDGKWLNDSGGGSGYFNVSEVAVTLYIKTSMLTWFVITFPKLQQKLKNTNITITSEGKEKEVIKL